METRPSIKKWLGAGLFALVVAPLASPIAVVALIYGLSSDSFKWLPIVVVFTYLLASIPVSVGVVSYLTVTWLLFGRMRHWPSWKWNWLGAVLGGLAVAVALVCRESMRWHEFTSSPFATFMQFVDSVRWGYVFFASVVSAVPGAVGAAIIRRVLTS